MAGVHVKAGPVWLPMGYKYGNARQTFNREEVEKMAAIIDAELAACPSCQAGTPVKHMTSTYRLDTEQPWGYTYQCRSGSRHYDPKTGTMVGRAHCSCDYCY